MKGKVAMSKKLKWPSLSTRNCKILKINAEVEPQSPGTGYGIKSCEQE